MKTLPTLQPDGFCKRSAKPSDRDRNSQGHGSNFTGAETSPCVTAFSAVREFFATRS
jgi:hypothetical protein